MKRKIIFLVMLSLIGLSSVFTQNNLPIVWSIGISETNINVRGNPVSVGQITINAPTEGKVLVHFNGSCSPSDGDRIVLAASDQVGWGTNDGSVSVSNIMGSFSHTRVYEVTQGEHTFHAVAQNYVEQNGTGIASIYAGLTVEFFPATSENFIAYTGISKSNINVRGNPVSVGQLTINAPTEGKVLVHFNGSCIPSNGDRIVLAASSYIGWGTNDGNVYVSNIRGNFSHTRVYSVNPGEHTFHAIAQNYVEQNGTGIASIYAGFTVEFFPATSDNFISHTGISKSNLNVRGNPVSVGELTINVPTEGKVLVHFNGYCTPSNGDRIVLAASDHIGWGTNDGNVSVLNVRGNFSHARVYDVTPGEHTFHAVAQNYVEQNGTGLASIYASLTVEFFASYLNNIEEIELNRVLIFPNPANDYIEIEGAQNKTIEIVNIQGQIVKSLKVSDLKESIDISKLSGGIYTMRVKTDYGIIVKKFIKQ